ncbi:hypothetical protein RZ532_21880 [Nitratireductor aquimarinus]|uniref:hypothetical protein n=1 Tax=Alphaproteobacteria TaxID=28211 RepID=UPI00293552FE|nr:hypothetical protein [Nitratireductor aquimarinus]MDV2968641.1 hypothetical protein [Nitratireductor aquimarinus]
MDICTFWFGSELRPVDRICLSSMVLAGYRVKLFSYGPVVGVPNGVELRDAEAILPQVTFKRLDPGYPKLASQISVVQYSDLFRVMLMKHGEGLWLDTDVYLVNRVNFDFSKPYLARENRSRLGVSAMYFPADHAVIHEFQNFIEGTDALPNWLGLGRGFFRPLWHRILGREVRPADIGITIFGNDGISRLAKKYKFFSTAAPKESFYYWTGKESERIFDPAYGLEPIWHPDFKGFHIHYKALTRSPLRQGSFYEWAVNRALKNNNLPKNSVG